MRSLGFSSYSSVFCFLSIVLDKCSVLLSFDHFIVCSPPTCDSENPFGVFKRFVHIHPAELMKVPMDRIDPKYHRASSSPGGGWECRLDWRVVR